MIIIVKIKHFSVPSSSGLDIDYGNWNIPFEKQYP